MAVRMLTIKECDFGTIKNKRAIMALIGGEIVKAMLVGGTDNFWEIIESTDANLIGQNVKTGKNTRITGRFSM